MVWKLGKSQYLFQVLIESKKADLHHQCGRGFQSSDLENYQGKISISSTYDSLFKMLYLVMKDITKKWIGRRQDWSQIPE